MVIGDEDFAEISGSVLLSHKNRGPGAEGPSLQTNSRSPSSLSKNRGTDPEGPSLQGNQYGMPTALHRNFIRGIAALNPVSTFC